MPEGGIEESEFMRGVNRDTEQLMARLKAEWNAIEAKKAADLDAVKAERQAGEQAVKAHENEVNLTAEVSKGETLATYEGMGLLQKQLVVATGISHTTMSRYLRYGRFLAVLVPKFNFGTRIREGYFRALWAQHSDEGTLRSLSGKSNLDDLRAYESLVFGDIVQKLQDRSITLQADGRKAYPRKHTPAQTPTVTVDPKAVRLFIRLKRKEVRELYNDIRQDVEDLIALIGRDRNSNRILSPDSLGIKAERLKRRWRELAKALSIEDVDVEVVNEN